MSRKKLLKTLDKSERNFKNISLKRLERIAKMQNLLQNELEQITRMKIYCKMNSKITKIRRIKKYQKIALLKSEQSLAELYKSESNKAELEEIKKAFNALRNK